MGKLYCAYGSNLNLDQMEMRCPTAKKLGVGKVKGYELLFKGDMHNAFATIEQNTEAEVDVLLWEIKAADERRLDCYEGYPSFYIKEMIPVQLEDGSIAEAMVYIMNPQNELGLPSLRYFETILQGYMENGLEPNKLIQAISNTYVQIIEQNQEPIQKMEM